MESLATQTLPELRRRIAEIASFRQPPPLADAEPGTAGLDALFPGGGLRRGMLVELVSSTEGAGAWSLGLSLARRACAKKRSLVVVDGQSWFYPLAAYRLGIDLRRCLVVRPPHWKDTFVALSQSLRCPAVGCVIGACERLATVDYQRLRVAAEAGGGLGILVRSIESLRSPTRASARLLVSPIASGDPSRRFRVEVLRGRGCGQALILELDDETGNVHLPASLARPATSPWASSSPV